MSRSLPENHSTSPAAGRKRRNPPPACSLTPDKAIKPSSRRSRTRGSDVPSVSHSRHGDPGILNYSEIFGDVGAVAMASPILSIVSRTATESSSGMIALPRRRSSRHFATSSASYQRP